MTGDDDALDAIEAALLARGVTRFLATVTTVEDERAAAAVERLARARARPGSAVAGIHLEGPFLSPEHPRRPPRRAAARARRRRAGALRPTRPFASSRWRPSCPGALDLIERLHARGVTVSLGHTGADADTIAARRRRAARAW